MRLTLINQFYSPDISPTAHLCASLAEHRAAGGDRVTVLTSATGYLAAVRSRPGHGNVRVRRLWSTRFGSRSNAGRLLDWVSFYLPALWAAARLPPQDVVICMTTPPFIALAGLLHKLLNRRCRLVLWNMDVYPEALERTSLVPARGLVATIMRSVNRAIFRRLDHLVALDGAMADLLLSQYTLPTRPVPHTIIPNWEKASLFPASGGPRAKWEDSLAGELANRWVALYLGNAGYGHEFQTMLDAADRLRCEPVSFLLVGGGPLRPWIAEQANRRCLGNLLLRDYVPKSQTPAVMALAACALITLDDAMLGVMSPSKLHANLAMGLPILYIGPAGSNVDRAIARFGCGVSLRPGDVKGVTGFLRQIMGDRDRHADLRRRARLAFEEAYCDGKTLPQFDALLKRLAT